MIYTKKCTYHMYIQTTKLEAGAKIKFCVPTL